MGPSSKHRVHKNNQMEMSFKYTLHTHRYESTHARTRTHIHSKSPYSPIKPQYVFFSMFFGREQFHYIFRSFRFWRFSKIFVFTSIRFIVVSHRSTFSDFIATQSVNVNAYVMVCAMCDVRVLRAYGYVIKCRNFSSKSNQMIWNVMMTWCVCDMPKNKNEKKYILCV